jgi:hypothetical protein
MRRAVMLGGERISTEMRSSAADLENAARLHLATHVELCSLSPYDKLISRLAVKFVQ